VQADWIAATAGVDALFQGGLLLGHRDILTRLGGGVAGILRNEGLVAACLSERTSYGELNWTETHINGYIWKVARMGERARQPHTDESGGVSREARQQFAPITFGVSGRRMGVRA
jgi:hypothetical protein